MIKDICEHLSFPTEATETFVNGYNDIRSQNCLFLFDSARELFFEGDTKQYRTLLAEVSKKTGIHKCTVDMIFLLTCTDRAKEIFDERGISEEIYYDTMRDLTAKLVECKKLHDVWGTFVIWWFPEFFRAERFALGRLQFEKKEFPFEDYKGIVKKGDTVYNFHVPSGGSFTHDAITDSFKRAYKFFGVKGIMPIFFSSWLIYPPHGELFADGSNLKNFYNLFDILDAYEYATNAEMWRIFYVTYSPETDLDALPEDTSLQRSFKQFLKNGGKMGGGRGMILFDGE
jgi:hypothetical protein